jgi:hypothetical protein
MGTIHDNALKGGMPTPEHARGFGQFVLSNPMSDLLRKVRPRKGKGIRAPGELNFMTRSP